MKRIVLYIVLLIPVSLSNSFAQNPKDTVKNDTLMKIPDIYINKILIAGNDITDEDIITRELTIKEKSMLNFKELEENTERLYRLGLFNKIDVIPVPTDTINVIDLMFLVEERFYLIPIPQGGFRNGEFSKFWAGLNLIWNNFRGRNETVSLSFGVGYEPFINLGYTIPWIGEKEHFFLSTTAGYSKNYNRSLKALNDTTSNSIPSSTDNFANYNFRAGVNIGKFFTREFSATSGLRYNFLNTSQYEEGRTVSPDGKDSYLTLSFNGRYDTRNSYEYSLAGSYYFLEYSKFGFGQLIDFNKVNFEARKFIPVKLGDDYAITLASRFFGTVSFGSTIPSYLKEFLGYDNIVRGYKNIVFEGENRGGLYNEIRIPIVTPFFVKGKSVPIAKRISALKDLNYKLGLYATLFFDVGGVWNKTDNFFDTPFKNGFGAGLNFILPFGAVGRTDFAFRKEGKRFVPQVIFDLNASM